MKKQSNQPAAPLSLEQGVNIVLSNSQKRIRDRIKKCENEVRKSPRMAVLGAVAVGYLLNRLPVRAILVTQVRVLSALTPPAVLLLGAAKLYELVQRQEMAKRK